MKHCYLLLILITGCASDPRLDRLEARLAENQKRLESTRLMLESMSYEVGSLSLKDNMERACATDPSIVEWCQRKRAQGLIR